MSLFDTFFESQGIATRGEVSSSDLQAVLDALNRRCGTKYKSAWFHQAKQRPNRQLPTCVREYMLASVLNGVLDKSWVKKLL